MGLAFLPVAVNIFHDDYGIVHEHAQGEDQAKQNDHVEGHAHQ